MDIHVNWPVSIGYRALVALSAANECNVTVVHPDYPHDTELLAMRSATHVRLFDAGSASNEESLTSLFSKVVRAGGRDAIRETISSLLDGAVDLELQTFDNGERDEPILHVVMKDYTVPLAAAGSGIYAAMRLGLELAAQPPGSVALIEEPEVHQHPAAIRQTAKILLGAARRGLQVIVSTHSLDLIDSLASLVRNDHPDFLNDFVVIRVALDQGTLRSSHFTGKMVEEARGAVDEDLR